MSKIFTILKILFVIACLAIIFLLVAMEPSLIFKSPVHHRCIFIVPIFILGILAVIIFINYLGVIRFLRRNKWSNSEITEDKYKHFELRIRGQLEKYHVFFPVFLLIGLIEIIGDLFNEIRYFVWGYSIIFEIGPPNILVVNLMSYYGNYSGYIIVCLLLLFFWLIFYLWKEKIIKNTRKHYYSAHHEEILLEYKDRKVC